MDDPLGKPAVTAPVSDDPKRALAVDALASAALAVSRGHGPTLFQELVRYLAATLEVECAFIASPHEDAPCSMRVFAFFLDGRVRENFEYPLSGTPCETVVGQTFRIYRTRLRETFPADLDFTRLGFDSYAGFPLQDSEGRALGLISVVSRKPMASSARRRRLRLGRQMRLNSPPPRVCSMATSTHLKNSILLSRK